MIKIKLNILLEKTTHKVEQLSSLTYKGDKVNMHETYGIDNGHMIHYMPKLAM